jgi:hypothetical protein
VSSLHPCSGLPGSFWEEEILEAWGGTWRPPGPFGQHSPSRERRSGVRQAGECLLSCVGSCSALGSDTTPLPSWAAVHLSTWGSLKQALKGLSVEFALLADKAAQQVSGLLAPVPRVASPQSGLSPKRPVLRVACPQSGLSPQPPVPRAACPQSPCP